MLRLEQPDDIDDRRVVQRVGPGRVLGDVLDSGAVPAVELTTLHRQAEGGTIARLAASVRGGELPPVDLIVTTRCALKTQPNHSCIALAQLAAGAQVQELTGRAGSWQQVRTMSGMSGWVPVEKVRVEEA